MYRFNGYGHLGASSDYFPYYLNIIDLQFKWSLLKNIFVLGFQDWKNRAKWDSI